jgi:hypothetical protein
MDILQLVREFGIPTLFALGMGYTVVQAWQWFASKVYLPQQERFFQFLDKLESHLDRLATNQSRLVEDMNKLSEAIESLEARVAAWELSVKK